METTNKLSHELSAIARRYFGTDQLEPQNSDAKDFKEVSVQNLKAALEAAFDVGKAQKVA